MTLVVTGSIAPLILRAEQRQQTKAATPLKVASKKTTAAPTVAIAPLKKQVTSTPAPANLTTPKHAKQKPTGHIWNLENADIKSVINEVAKETGKNFLIDPRVAGQVNLISTKPLPPNALYNVFLAMLQTYGFSAIPGKNIIRIVPDISAPQMASPLATNQHPSAGSHIVVRVIPVAHISATQLLPILRPLMPQWSTISAYSPANLLIVSGTAANLTRLAHIIQQIDVVSNNAVSIIPLKNANAEQITKILKNLQSSAQTNGGSTAQVAIDSDARTNSIILSGNQSERLRLSVIVTQLDAPSSAGQGSTQVIFLHYLNAKKLAPILDKIAKGQGGTSGNTENSPTATFTANNTTTNTSNSSSNSKNDDADDISNLTAVLPEIDDNAVIITASKSLMSNLKAIIQQLDIRPQQVYVQAIIVELDSSSLEKLGFQWGTFFGSNDGSNPNPSISGDGSIGGDFNGGTGVGVIRNGHFAALVAAIKGLSGADILSEPTIMVQNNQKASFSVGKQVPVQESQQASLDSTSSTGVPNTLNTFKQEDVGLKLTVTPQINRGKSVQLTINQANGSLQNPDNPTTTPIINKSEIKTSVLVNSGDILALGGLMSNNMTTSTFKTPVLGDIPILGHFFSYTSHQLQKKDLMIFLRPVIIKTALDGTNITNKKYQMVRNLQLNWRYDKAGKDSPNDRLLPPRDRNLPLPLPFSGS